MFPGFFDVSVFFCIDVYVLFVLFFFGFFMVPSNVVFLLCTVLVVLCSGGIGCLVTVPLVTSLACFPQILLWCFPLCSKFLASC